MDSAIEIQNLDVSYGKTDVLHSVSMNLIAGDRILLIGPNGAGKTTLLRSLMGLLKPSTGHIHFFGKHLNHMSVRRRVEMGLGYLLQTENVVPSLTVEDNFSLGSYLLRKGESERRKEAILDLMPSLAGKLKNRAGILSGGERQLLALGILLMARPRVLLLDEPSAGLAPKAAGEIIGKLKQLQKRFKVETVCMVEHNLKLGLEWSSKVIVLVQGHIALISENPERFLDHPQELEKYYFENQD